MAAASALSLQAVAPSQPPLAVPHRFESIPGFEATDYARSNGRIVWLGEAVGGSAHVDHPRNFYRPWHAAPRAFDAQRLQRGAQRTRAALAAQQSPQPTGLLGWLSGAALPFPLQLARTRFDAVADALTRNDIGDFEVAALRVLGLGPGLTPSGDDFIGGIFFALAHAPRAAWAARLPALRERIHRATVSATNPISAALLGDLMAGTSYRTLHDLLAAWDDEDLATATHAAHAAHAVQQIGAHSGADMLSGLLLVLSTAPADLA